MNKKWLIAIYTMLSVFVVGVVTTVIVLASGTHYVGSNISVVYTASGIGGKLTATYQVGSNTAVNMVGSSGETVIEFGSEEPETVALLSPGDTIVPGYKEDIILTYTFVNEGPTFYATVTYSDTSSENPKDNIAITYKGESDTEYKNKSAVVTVPQLETVSYSIKLSIALPYMDASMDGMIKWALTEEEPIIEETVDNLTLSIANNGDSSVNDANVKAVLSEDGTQFKIVGAVPESAGPTTSSGYVNGSYNNRNAVLDAEKGLMSVAELTNTSTGAEFFYFCTNPEVVGNTTYGYIDPSTIYWTSTSDTTLETWYDVPTEPITLYSCFMKPNCTSNSFTGTESRTALYEGTDTQIVISNDVVNIPYMAFYNKAAITNVAIPQSVKNIGYGTSSKSYGSFQNCSALTRIDLPNSVKCLNAYAFAYCQSLTSVTLPSSITDIDDSTFFYCECITNITIPDGVTRIGDAAFNTCSGLTNITIPNSVTTIEKYAFGGCTSLMSVTIPSEVTSIGMRAFHNCTNLTYNEYDNAYYLGNDNNKYVVLMKAKTTDITACEINSDTKFIHSYAFQYCSKLTNISIPNSVTSIGLGAFFDCSKLSSVTIPNSVKSIGEYAFYCCSELNSIEIPISIKSIPEGAFYGSGLKRITMYNSLESIGVSALIKAGNGAVLETVTYHGTKAEFETLLANSDDECGLSMTSGEYTINVVTEDYPSGFTAYQKFDNSPVD